MQLGPDAVVQFIYMADFSNQGPGGSRRLPKIDIIAILALRQSAPNMDRLSFIG